MVDNLILYFGINGLESLIQILFIIGFSFKNVGKSNLILTWLVYNSFNFLVTRFIGIPPFNQIVIILLGGLLLSVLLDKNIIRCMKCMVIMFLLCIVFETSSVILLCNIFNISFFDINYATQFIILLPARLLEIITMFLISGGVIRMKYWWNDIKRKQPTKK